MNLARNYSLKHLGISSELLCRLQKVMIELIDDLISDDAYGTHVLLDALMQGTARTR
jgi:hypothetical protein